MLPAVSDMLEKKGFFLAEIEVKLLIEEELTRLKTPEMPPPDFFGRRHLRRFSIGKREKEKKAVDKSEKGVL